MMYKSICCIGINPRCVVYAVYGFMMIYGFSRHKRHKAIVLRIQLKGFLKIFSPKSGSCKDGTRTTSVHSGHQTWKAEIHFLVGEYEKIPHTWRVYENSPQIGQSIAMFDWQRVYNL